jgi:hypothetical protein
MFDTEVFESATGELMFYRINIGNWGKGDKV